MKLTLNNIGPIHKFEFDLEKDIHLIYGKNNVGKSYAVNFLYCFLSSFAYHDAVEMITLDNDELYLINKKIEKVIAKRLSKKIQNFNLFISQTYSNISTSNSSDIKIHCEANAFSFLTVYEKRTGFYIKEVTLKEKHTLETPLIKIDTYTGKYKLIKEKFSDIFNPNQHQYDLYFMPSSRSSLYDVLNGMGQLLAALSNTNLPEEAKQFRLPSLQNPVASYYLRLTEMIGSNFEESVGYDLINKVEEKILNGKIVTDIDNKKIYFQQGKNKFHITETSSLVSELAPLVLYVKALLGSKFEAKNKILIIEEPEAHLHPEVQVKLLEIFVELAKQNVKIIMTSHSNYMFNKLSNMLLKGSIQAEKVGIYHMEMTEKGSVVKEEIKATDEGIDDHNFATVAEKLYNERLEIYHQLNEEQDAYQTTKK